MNFANLWATILSEEALKLVAISLMGLLYKKLLEERIKKYGGRLLKAFSPEGSSATDHTVSQKNWKQKIKVGSLAFLDGLAIFFLFLGIAYAGNLIGRGMAIVFSTDEDTSRYNFEDKTTQGWDVSTDLVRGIGLTGPGVDEIKPLKGKCSLIVHATLDGTETDSEKRKQYAKHQGEVYVDPKWSLPNGVEPFGVTKGLDLSGKTVKALVAVTGEGTGADSKNLVGKDLSKPINLQLFVEECDQRLPKILSDPKPISAGSSPTALELPVGSDKKAICRIGIKIALDEKDYNKNYGGYLRIDAVDW